MTDWDPQRDAYRMEPVQNFVAEVQRRLAEKKLSKDDLVVLMCRSGDRSSRAANRLAEAGFTHVYSVVDGFEGDLGTGAAPSTAGRTPGCPGVTSSTRRRCISPTEARPIFPRASGLSIRQGRPISSSEVPRVRGSDGRDAKSDSGLRERQPRRCRLRRASNWLPASTGR